MERSEVLEHIRKAIGSENLSPLRSRAGCRVDMTGAPSPRVVVDADVAFLETNGAGPPSVSVAATFTLKRRAEAERAI